MRLTIAETVTTDSGIVKEAPFANNGPSFTLPPQTSGDWVLRRGLAGHSNLHPELAAHGGVGDDGTRNPGTTPMRITVYVKVAEPPTGTLAGHWGAHIALHEDDFRPVLTTQAGLPSEGWPNGTGGAGSGGPSGSNFEGVAGDGGLGGGIGNDSMAMVGVAIVDGKFKHAANYRHTPGADVMPEATTTVAQRQVRSGRWYKVDIYLSWPDSTYKVRIDDVTVVRNQTFRGAAVRRLGLYAMDSGTVWFDEASVSWCPCGACWMAGSASLARPIELYAPARMHTHETAEAWSPPSSLRQACFFIASHSPTHSPAHPCTPLT